MGKAKLRVTAEVSESARSSVTNGYRLFADKTIDGRTSWARRLRDLIVLHTLDLGGEDVVSVAEQSILRRASTLSVECELLEKKFALANGADPEDLQLYITASNSLRRLLETLGLKRVARDVTPLNDIIAELDLETAEADANGDDVE